MGLMQKVLNEAPGKVRAESSNFSFLEKAERMRAAQASVDKLFSLSGDIDVKPEAVVQSICSAISELPTGRLIGHHVFGILTDMLQIQYAALLLSDHSIDNLRIVLHKNLDVTTRNKLCMSKSDVDNLTNNMQKTFLQIGKDDFHILKPYFSTILLDTLEGVCIVPLYAQTESVDQSTRTLGMLIFGAQNQAKLFSETFTILFRSLAPITSKLLREHRYNDMYMDPVITESFSDQSITESSADIVLNLYSEIETIGALFPYIPKNVFLDDFFQATKMAMHNLGHCALRADEMKILLLIDKTAMGKQAIRTALCSVWRRLYPEHELSELFARL